jgi:hypothetical protein
MVSGLYRIKLFFLLCAVLLGILIPRISIADPLLSIYLLDNDFGCVGVGTSQCKNCFVLENVGSELLLGNISVSSPFSATQQSFSLTPGSQITIQICFAPITGGFFYETVNVSSNGGDENASVEGIGVSVSPLGSLGGEIYDSGTTRVIRDVQVEQVNGSNLAITVSEGSFFCNGISGNYFLEISAIGYFPKVVQIYIEEGAMKEQNFELERKPSVQPALMLLLEG